MHLIQILCAWKNIVILQPCLVIFSILKVSKVWQVSTTDSCRGGGGGLHVSKIMSKSGLSSDRTVNEHRNVQEKVEVIAWMMWVGLLYYGSSFARRQVKRTRFT